jgi:hypothetical protein
MAFALVEEFGDGDGDARVQSEHLLTVAHRPGR